MFENFVIFTEVIKLSSNVFYQMENINYSDKLPGLIFQKEDFRTLKLVSHLIEDIQELETVIKNWLWYVILYGETAVNFLDIIFINNLQLDECFDEALNLCIKYGRTKHIEYLDKLLILKCGRSITDHKIKYSEFYIENSIDFLEYALENGNLDVVKYFIKIGIKGYYDTLTYAFDENYFHKDVILYILENNKEIYNEKLLTAAIQRNELEVVQYIIENELDRPSNDVLKLAADHGYYEIVSYLVEHGADESVLE